MLNTGLVGVQVAPDGREVPIRLDSYANVVIQRNGPWYMEQCRRGNCFVYSQPAAGVNQFAPTATSVITTGAFVTGQRYQIANVGDTDFTLIGAASNTIGVEFVATGPGGGTTGTANLMSSTPMIWNRADSGVNFIPIRLTMGLIGAVAPVLGPFGLWAIPSPGDSSGVVTVPSADVGTPVNSLIGNSKKSNVVFSPQAQLLTTAPTFVKSLPWNILANDLTGKNMITLEYNFTGRAIVRPNNAVFIGPIAADAFLAIISIEGMEIPIQSGGI